MGTDQRPRVDVDGERAESQRILERREESSTTYDALSEVDDSRCAVGERQADLVVLDEFRGNDVRKHDHLLQWWDLHGCLSHVQETPRTLCRNPDRGSSSCNHELCHRASGFHDTWTQPIVIIDEGQCLSDTFLLDLGGFWNFAFDSRDLFTLWLVGLQGVAKNTVPPPMT
jgi:hypothetical protein